MSDIYIPRSDPRAEFIDYLLGGYHVLAPRFLVERHPRPSWEATRFQSMESHLRPGDILFDIGAEQGQQSAIYARFVGGGDHMVLFEPTPQSWPNIHATWKANGLANPLACCCGFVSNETRLSMQGSDFHMNRNVWPLCASTDLLIDATKFCYDSPAQQQSSVDSVTIDRFVEYSGIVPTALTMDVEGYESRVLEGAVLVLRTYKPKLWVSIHAGDNNMLRRFEGGDPVADVHRLLNEAGYEGQMLSLDHEQHWMFVPRQ